MAGSTPSRISLWTEPTQMIPKRKAALSMQIVRSACEAWIERRDAEPFA